MKEANAFWPVLKAALEADAGAGVGAAAGIVTQLTAAHGGTLPNPSPIWSDTAPPNSAQPYLSFNEASDDSWDTDATQGAELLVDVHAWTDQPARDQAAFLIQRLEDLCFDPAWTVPGFTLVYCRPLRSKVEADGEGFHGVLTLRVIIGHG